MEYEAFTGEKDRDGKTHWTKIGVVFQSKSGKGLVLKLNALPIPGDNGCWVMLFPPRAREERQPAGDSAAAYRGASRGGAPASEDPDDEIPF